MDFLCLIVEMRCQAEKTINCLASSALVFSLSGSLYPSPSLSLSPPSLSPLLLSLPLYFCLHLCVHLSTLSHSVFLSSPSLFLLSSSSCQFWFLFHPIISCFLCPYLSFSTTFLVLSLLPQLLFIYIS